MKKLPATYQDAASEPGLRSLRFRLTLAFGRVCCFLALCLVSSILSGKHSLSAAAPLTPGTSVTIVNKGDDDPLWKQWWDSARDLVKREKYPEAIEKYRAVLREKPHVEEVKWELCKVLAAAGDYEDASLILESLLEGDEDRIEYLISGGKIALSEGKYEQAAHYFGRAVEQNPTGEYSDEALQGLIRSLIGSGKREISIPLMEQLYQRGVVEPELLRDLARFCVEFERLEQASYYYSELVKKFRVSAEVVKEAACVLEKTGRVREAAKQWRNYLEHDPDYDRFRLKLSDYYLKHDEPLKALPHMLVLLDRGIRRDMYLLRVANIYLYDLGRADKALNYFEQYRQEFPWGVDVSKEIADLQLVLANDLLTIVENDGGWQLWRDLARVTPARIGIYRAMATLLENIHREKELLEVLQIIAVHVPGDLETHMKIAAIHQKNGSYGTCLNALDEIKSLKNLPASYYLLRSECERGAGKDEDMLSSYQAYLAIRGDDEAVRTKALIGAGDLGRIELLDRLYYGDDSEKKKKEAISFSRSMVYVDELLKNHLYSKVISFVDGVAVTVRDGNRLRLLAEKKATAFNGQGRGYRAEQLLRKNATHFPDSIEPLLALADLALDNADPDAAAVWLSYAQEMLKQTMVVDGGAELKTQILYRMIRYDALSGDDENARHAVLEHMATVVQEKRNSPGDIDMLLFLAKHYYRSHRYAACVQLLDRFRRVLEKEEAFSIMAERAEKKLNGGNETGGKDAKKETNITRSVVRRLATCEILIDLEEYDEALRELRNIEDKVSASVRWRTLAAKAYLGLAAYDNAGESYRLLIARFPTETFFREQSYRVQFLRGRTKTVLEEVVSARPLSSEDRSLAPPLFQTSEPALEILKARALWADDQWSEALMVYDRLFQALGERVEHMYELVKDNADVADLKSESFFATFFSQPNAREIIDIIMAPSFFAKYRGEEIARISVDFYDDYRWQKAVQKERAARRALNAREFYQAEQNYQELFDEHVDAEAQVYPDLATVYSRLGKHKKETEIFEKIKGQKIESPVIQEAEKKNVRRRRPHLAVDAHYKEEKGRDGHIDITKKYSGIGLGIMPTSFQEAGFLFARNEYGDSDASTRAKSNYLLSKYSVLFSDVMEGEAQLGFEDFDTDGKSFILYDVSLTAHLEEQVNIFVSSKQAPVEDTSASLMEGVYRRSLQAGLTVDYLPRIFLGFDFSIVDYNDSNDGKLFDLWASYRLFGETSSLELTYDYSKMEHTITNLDELETATDQSTERLDDLSYWSPRDYWKHLLTADYKLELWPTGRLQSGTGFIATRYGIGYEKGNNLFQTFELNISLEMSSAFLLKGTFSSDWTKDYDRWETSASLAYRW